MMMDECFFFPIAMQCIGDDAVPLFSLVMIMGTMQGTWKDVLLCYTLILIIVIIGQDFSSKIILLLILTL